MKQLTEDYVSYEIAILLKEKGFDIPLENFYNYNGLQCCATQYNWNQTEGEYPDYSRPTLQMALKWLREVHGIIILINFYRKERYSYDILLDGECGDNYILYSAYMVEYYQSYEEAVEAACLYALKNLI